MKYENSIKLAVFDWAGTTVDYGSFAPNDVFGLVFEEADIHLTREEINGPMGMEKKAHIRALLSLDTASVQWKNTYGRDWNEDDVEHLYEKFEEKLYEVVKEYSIPIEGVVETVEALRKNEIKIGSTTGYNNIIMNQVIPAAESCGYRPDCVVTPDAAGVGRPAPFMLFECMRKLNVYPPKAVVKVGDTIADIHEGKNAGAWSIGILTGSNLLGLRKEEYGQMSAKELAVRKAEAAQKYLEAGADMVIDNIRELPAAIEKINCHMAKEEELRGSLL